MRPQMQMQRPMQGPHDAGAQPPQMAPQGMANGFRWNMGGGQGLAPQMMNMMLRAAERPDELTPSSAELAAHRRYFDRQFGGGTSLYQRSAAWMKMADPQLLISVGAGLMSGARYGSNAGEGLMQGLQVLHHAQKTSDLQNQIQRQQVQEGATGTPASAR